ncbi:response regulator [Henriciella litoralis]|uniref:response regulator n=1 Tax=Henriciella litoralis TaxID=568102 RepID=UPI000A068E2C|nr:response regulator [Henriciella litoralis]
MHVEILDHLPVLVCETCPVRNEAGEIVDYEWTMANRLMNESILPDGSSIVGMRVFEFDPSYRSSDMIREIETVLATGQPATMITGQGRAAKMLKTVLKTTLIPTKDGVLSCSHEVTDLAKERDQAIDRAELLQTACDSAVHAIAIADRHGTLLYTNDALLELAGYEAGSLVGQHTTKIFDRAALKKTNEIFRNASTGERLKHIAETELISSTGERIQVAVAMNSAVLPGQSEPVFITHIQDIREEHRKALELKAALHEAEQATRMKSEFLANMSHEIRTPLNGVLGMAQTLAAENLTPSQAQQVSIILESGQSLMVLLNDLLDLSKIEAGKMDITPVPADLHHKLTNLYKLHRTQATEKGLGIRLHIDPSVPPALMLDPVRVRQCLNNIISNAIKFTAEGEILIVATTHALKGGRLELIVHVSDTGCGIAADKLDQIFESFTQEDGSITRKFGGTGLGLAVTRDLARMMGGDLNVVSEQGRGSVFTLKIVTEAVAPELQLQTRRQASRRVPARRQTVISGSRALVVDDNALNLRVLRTFLEMYDIDICEASDGREALSKLDTETFDFVLMDVHMPKMDGVEALRRLRMSNSRNRQVPVLALTADAMSGDRERFISLGFDGYVSKPIEERDLISAIGQVLYVTSGKEVRLAG